MSTKAATLKQKEKKIDYALKQVSARRTGKSPQALVQQRQSFSNLDPFPMEQEQERVLAWFEKRDSEK